MSVKVLKNISTPNASGVIVADEMKGAGNRSVEETPKMSMRTLTDVRLKIEPRAVEIDSK